MNRLQELATDNFGKNVTIHTKSGQFNGYVESIGEQGMIFETMNSTKPVAPISVIPLDIVPWEEISNEQFPNGRSRGRFRRRFRRRRRRRNRFGFFWFIPWFWILSIGEFSTSSEN